MSFEVLYTRKGKCECCGGSLTQGYSELFPTMCYSCNALYIRLRDSNKHKKDDVHLSDIISVLFHILKKDLEDDVIRKPIITMTDEEYEQHKKHLDEVFRR